MKSPNRARADVRDAWAGVKRAWAEVKRTAKPLRGTLLTLAAVSVASSVFTVWLLGWPGWVAVPLSLLACVVLGAGLYGPLKALVEWRANR